MVKVVVPSLILRLSSTEDTATRLVYAAVNVGEDRALLSFTAISATPCCTDSADTCSSPPP